MILTLDTSLADLHIGLFSVECSLLADFHHITTPDERGIHDALVAQSTAEILMSVSKSASEISKIAIVNGPGSFTGLRIGLSFAKGLAFGSGATIVPLRAHAIMRYAFEKKNPAHSEIDVIYPGYERTSVYLSTRNNPDEITYTENAKLHSLGIQKALALPATEVEGIECIAQPIDLLAMAQLAVTQQGFSGIGIGDLEPFYGADFKTNAV
ncbi:MAG: tRNA (adenosine(37)-N6)-threonylcarbamoyltransferase complex dimerization subunit type 1 TsaB [bacterium]